MGTWAVDIWNKHRIYDPWSMEFVLPSISETTISKNQQTWLLNHLLLLSKVTFLPHQWMCQIKMLDKSYLNNKIASTIFIVWDIVCISGIWLRHPAISGFPAPYVVERHSMAWRRNHVRLGENGEIHGTFLWDLWDLLGIYGMKLRLMMIYRMKLGLYLGFNGIYCWNKMMIGNWSRLSFCFFISGYFPTAVAVDFRKGKSWEVVG